MGGHGGRSAYSLKKMFINSWRFRIGVIGAALVLVSVHLVLTGGQLFPGSRPGILIEFGVDPQLLEGVPVEIDGHVVGQLKRYGQSTRTAFDVSRGEHTIRILCSGFECQPAKVSTTMPGQRVMLLVDIGETVDPKGRPIITLRG